MAISRRAVGLGLLGLSVAGTGGYVLVKDRPEFQGLLGQHTSLFGFMGGEKQAFLADPEIVSALAGWGLVLDARVAGSVEMVREPTILSQNPQFLWPSSAVMVDLARQSGVKVRRDQIILNTPLVVYSWSSVADGLQSGGLVSTAPDGTRQIDLKALLDDVLKGGDWAALGVPQLFGQARIVSTDPNRSNSGFMFAGLVLNLFAGQVATADDLATHRDDTLAIFRAMGLKSSSSGKLFDQYLAGGPGAAPLVVGYENQLLEWVLADPQRWQRITAGNGPKPVVLYPRPTVFSAHPLIAIDPAADRLIDALMSDRLQELAWTRHGFRGPLGALATQANVALPGAIPAEIDAVLPTPAAEIMTALLAEITS